MGVKYVEDDYEEQEKMGDDEKTKTHENIKTTLERTKAEKKTKDKDELLEAQSVDDKTAAVIKMLRISKS